MPSDTTFEQQVREMDAERFAYLLDRSIFVVEEAKRRGVLGAASADAFQRALASAHAAGEEKGRADALALSTSGARVHTEIAKLEAQLAAMREALTASQRAFVAGLELHQRKADEAIAKARAEGEEKGRREMREEAAKLLDAMPQDDGLCDRAFEARELALDEAATLIRTLPTTPPTPNPPTPNPLPAPGGEEE